MIDVNENKCAYCGACVGVCPVSALRLKDGKIFCDEKCTSCGICSEACPLGAITIRKK
ncbi:MAG: 4Fe-4S binding protein [Candidatus Micrarchaeota archaeon]